MEKIRGYLIPVLFLCFCSFFIPHFIPLYALQQKDVDTQIKTPAITPPDYTKNECPICEPGLTWWGSREGCCKIQVISSEANVKAGAVCQQPNNVVCENRFFCLNGTGCLLGRQVSNFQPDNLCEKIIEAEDKSNCHSCMQDNQHVWTAFGCLPADIGKFISQTVSGLFMGVSGGLAFLIFIYGIYLVMTSAGDTEKILEGKKYISSAIKGLLIIIFGLLILRIMTVNILRIPGFS